MHTVLPTIPFPLSPLLGHHPPTLRMLTVTGLSPLSRSLRRRIAALRVARRGHLLRAGLVRPQRPLRSARRPARSATACRRWVEIIIGRVPCPREYKADAVQVLYVVCYHAHFAGYSASHRCLMRTQGNNSGFFWRNAPGSQLV